MATAITFNVFDGLAWKAEKPRDQALPVSASRETVKQPAFDEAYLARFRGGDDATARHFDRYFRRVLRAQLWSKFSRQRQEDLIDEVMVTAIQKIMAGEPRDATRLPAYIRGICSNLTKVAMRPHPNREHVQFDFDRIPSPGRGAEQRLLERETAAIARKVLATLSPRDRDILLSLLDEGLKREEVCSKYGLTREQLRLLLFRARRRFQESWKQSDC